MILTDANRDRFIRCFISKMVIYANGVEPSYEDYLEIDKILEKSAAHDYRIVDTIAAFIHSPLFRERLVRLQARVLSMKYHSLRLLTCSLRDESPGVAGLVAALFLGARH